MEVDVYVVMLGCTKQIFTGIRIQWQMTSDQTEMLKVQLGYISGDLISRLSASTVDVVVSLDEAFVRQAGRQSVKQVKPSR